MIRHPFEVLHIAPANSNKAQLAHAAQLFVGDVFPTERLNRCAKTIPTSSRIGLAGASVPDFNYDAPGAYTQMIMATGKIVDSQNLPLLAK